MRLQIDLLLCIIVNTNWRIYVHHVMGLKTKALQSHSSCLRHCIINYLSAAHAASSLELLYTYVCTLIFIVIAILATAIGRIDLYLTGSSGCIAAPSTIEPSGRRA